MHFSGLALNSYQKASNLLIPFVRSSSTGYAKLFIEVYQLRMFLAIDLFLPPLGSVFKTLAEFGLVSTAPQVNINSTVHVRNHYEKLPCFLGYCFHRYIETLGFTVLVFNQ